MKKKSDNSPVKEIRPIGPDVLAIVVGDIDLARSMDFQRDLLDILDSKPRRLVIDLSGVPYMDSSGVASLVKLMARARKGNIVLSLACLTDRVRGVFEITRLDNVFQVFKTTQEALA